MKFSELYNFALNRRVLTEAYDATSVSTKGPPETETIAAFIGRVYGKAGVVNSLVTGEAGNLGATAGSAQSYTKKQLLEEMRGDLPILNVLAYFYNVLGKKDVGDSFLTKTGVDVTVDSGIASVPPLKLTTQAQKWDHLVTKLNPDTVAAHLNLLEAHQGKVDEYLEAAKKTQGGLIFPALARRLTERDQPSMSLETLININPIFRSVAFAVAQHFNDTGNSSPENTYRRVLNSLFNAPQHLTFMFSNGFGNGDVLGMYRGSSTDQTAIDVKTSKLEINLAADDPETRNVLGHINTIAANLLQFVVNLYTKYKATGDADMKNDDSATTTGSRKSELESSVDGTFMQQMYIDLLTKEFHGASIISGIESQFRDEYHNFIDEETDPSTYQALNGLVIKTIKDMEVIENSFGLAKVTPAIKRALQELSVPMTPASILGLSQTFATAMSRLDRARV
jgi:hypothetical protein